MAEKGRSGVQNYNQFLAELRRQDFASIYLFLGEEDFLATQGTALLRAALLSQTDDVWNGAEYDAGDTDPGAVVVFLTTLPVLAAHRVVVLRNIQQWNAGEIENLLPLLTDMPDYAHLILIAPHLDKRGKCYRTVQSHGRVVDISRLDPTIAAAWAMERARTYGLRLNRVVALELVKLVGTSLWVLDKELEKLATYKDANDAVMTREDVTLLAIPSREAADNAIFRFVDALASGDRVRSLQLLGELLATGREPLAILGMIARQWRIIAFAWEAAQSGVSLEEVGRELKVRDFVLRKAVNQGRQMGTAGIRRALGATLGTDREIKTGRHSGPRALEILVIRLTVPGTP